MWQFGVKMNLEQAKKKLINISQSTATKHPKVLIGELCIVIKFLLDEIEKIKLPPITVLKQLPDLDPMKPIGPPPPPQKPYKSPPPYDPLRKHRKGNTGNAT